MTTKQLKKNRVLKECIEKRLPFRCEIHFYPERFASSMLYDGYKLSAKWVDKIVCTITSVGDGGIHCEHGYIKWSDIKSVRGV